MSEPQPTTDLSRDQEQTIRLIGVLDGCLSAMDTDGQVEGSLEKIVQNLVTLVEADTGILFQLQQETETLEPVVSVSRDEAEISADILEALKKLASLVKQERQAQAFKNFPDWANQLQDKALPRIALAVPLLYQDHLEGVLVLTGSQKESNFTELDQKTAGLFARLAVLTILTDNRRAQIERLTITDNLTGVWTRSQFFERAELAFRQAVRYQRPLSAVLVDIDRFKMLNEMHGYPVGDQVLGTVARNIRSRLRDSDLLGRYGGDEFIMLLPETDLEHARMAAERMRSQIAAAPTETPKGTFFVTISAGVASLESATIDQLDRLLDFADQAVHAAKLAGRNQVAVYPDDINSLA